MKDLRSPLSIQELYTIKGIDTMAEKKSILLRLSPNIWEEINRWAEDEFRSVNGQIEYLLQEAINKRKKVKSESSKEGE